MTSTNAAATAKIQSERWFQERERNVPGQYPTRSFLPENNTSQDFSKELEKGDQRKSEVSGFFYTYYDTRDVLTVQSELVFKEKLLLVSACIRKELIAIVRSSHIEMEGSILGAHDILYWPRMLNELKEYICKCNMCLGHSFAQGKESLLYNTHSWHDPNPRFELNCANLTAAPT